MQVGTIPLSLMISSLVAGVHVSDSMSSSKIWWIFSCKKLFQGCYSTKSMSVARTLLSLTASVIYCLFNLTSAAISSTVRSLRRPSGLISLRFKELYTVIVDLVSSCSFKFPIIPARISTTMASALSFAALFSSSLASLIMISSSSSPAFKELLSSPEVYLSLNYWTNFWRRVRHSYLLSMLPVSAKAIVENFCKLAFLESIE